MSPTSDPAQRKRNAAVDHTLLQQQRRDCGLQQHEPEHDHRVAEQRPAVVGRVVAAVPAVAEADARRVRLPRQRREVGRAGAAGADGAHRAHLVHEGDGRGVAREGGEGSDRG